MVSMKLVFCLSVTFSLICKTWSICSKIPDVVTKPKDRNVGGKYFIEIAGNPNSYIPGQTYKVYLKSNPMELKQRTFQNFILSFETEGGENLSSLGQLNFEQDIEMLARFSSSCANTIIESNTVPKTEIEVDWTAPPKGSQCVYIRATVVESKENWYSEDDSLTKILCEDTVLDANIAPQILETCCACDEAKYELIFEGKWTRNTHPKDFPTHQWNIRFSDLIGASHHYGHAFWNYGYFATDGLKSLAENGDTSTLESELKNNSENIRTIIKARGLVYPNITKSSYAVFRVDRNNHLVSLVTKMVPSPDWIVGVSNFELCEANCTWAESRTLNLYPWDVGINDGIGYQSSVPLLNKIEHQPIRKISPNSPNDPRSPFYSKGGEKMKPIAQLYLNRQRLYPKTCGTSPEQKSSCANDKWSDWTPCSVTCGVGERFRKRALMDESQASDCNLSFIEYEPCFTESCTDAEESDPQSEPDKEVENEPSPTTESIKNLCGHNGQECENDPKCPSTLWGPWVPCSVSCGTGTRTRLRIGTPEEGYDDNDCPTSKEEVCHEQPCEGEEQPLPLGSDSQIVSQGPVGEVIDCKLTKWSAWSDCIFRNNRTCGRGYKYKFRKIKIHRSNGGKECSNKLMKISNCTIPCSANEETQNQCIMSTWSSWTPCSASCGRNAVRIRTRQIVKQPEGVTKCPPREQKQSCSLPLACTRNEIPGK